MNFNYRPLTVLFFIFVTLSGKAQNKYWILHSPHSQSALSDWEIIPQHCSETIDLCSYILDDQQKQQLAQLGAKIIHVKSFQNLKSKTNTIHLNFALEQIHAEAIIEEGLTGKNVKIGIIDGGFLDADENLHLENHFKQKRIAYYKDYITPNLAPYDGNHQNDDSHGTEVWQLIGGKDPEKNLQYGLATEATYYLARTDHGAFEKRIEEDLLIIAIEDMLKMGVRLFNLSIGYTNGYDISSENYTPEQIDGHFSPLTQMINAAAKKHDALFVISAGNDGNTPWKTLAIPADAEEALTVGASKHRSLEKMNYSSVGSAALAFPKPNITVFSSTGTSFSAPVITGLAACMMQFDSTLSYREIISIIEQSSQLYPYPNNYVGYGTPDVRKILKLLNNQKINPSNKTIHTQQQKVKITGDWSKSAVTFYNKTNEYFVLSTSRIHCAKRKLKITRPKEAKQTTVAMGRTSFEIFWE